jgi:Tol biopolymer transport system component
VILALILAGLSLSSCSGGWLRRTAGAGGIGLTEAGREDPALSGDGRFLASVVKRGGRATLLLQEQPSGRTVSLRHLGRHQPHSSPSLSWNGRYVAVLVQQGSGRLAVIEDRATGHLHRLPLPGDQQPERLSLSPDGRRLAMELLRGGLTRVQVFDLANLLEPDLPAGMPVRGGGPP